VTALIDSGAQENFLSQRVIVEAGFQGEPTSIKAHTVDGSPVRVYGRHTIVTRATDMRGVSMDSRQSYIATDIRRYDMILGFPWLKAMNPDIDWDRGTWEYRASRQRDKGAYRVTRVSSVDMDLSSGPVMVLRCTFEGSTPKWNTANAGVPPALSGGCATAFTGLGLYSVEVAEPQLPEEYEDWADVFSEEAAARLSEVTAVTHKIRIEEGKEVPYGPIYPLSAHELRVLREYLEDSLRKGWIRKSESPAGAPILFVQKKDGSLRLCVDYRGLNRITVKNRHALPLIGETLDRLAGAKIYSKLDLQDAYHRIRIARGDEWKTAFRTRYGHYEYLVMPFGLTNAPATFQSYMNEALKGLLDDICVAYMDDIMIFSQSREEHVKHVRLVLDRLRKYSLYAKLKKCEFHKEEVDFLGYRIGVAGIAMDPRRVQAVVDWPVPVSYREIQVFLGFTNFYRIFIHRYSAETAPITDLLKGMEKGKKTGPFTWTEEADHAFHKLKDCFTRAPLLAHFDETKPSQVETDASENAVSGILSQTCEWPAGSGRTVWKPVAFFSRKLDQAERNYTVGDQEMLAIVESFKEWRHYLDSPAFPTRVLTDHHNLQGFMSTKSLGKRQARWAEIMAAYDFEIIWRKGKENPADGPSRRPDYCEKTAIGNPMGDLLRQKCVAGEEHDDHMRVKCEPLLLGALMTRSKTLRSGPPQESAWNTLPTAAAKGEGERHIPAPPMREASVAPEREPEIPEVPSAQEEPKDSSEESPYGKIPSVLTTYLLELQSRDAWCKQREWERVPEGRIKSGPYKGRWCADHAGLMRCDGAVYIPEDPATIMEVLRVNHDDPWQGGHFGRNRTEEVIRRFYWWKGLAESVRDYCATCDVCQRMKVPRHKPYGLLAPLPQPDRPWQDISLDFIVGLPPSLRRRQACDAILVVVCRFSKMARYIPCTGDIDARELAELLDEEIFSKVGTPRSIVSDRGTTFTSEYWGTLCYYSLIKRCFSTAFHPQTDGQTERTNQTLECYLRCYINFEQDDWARLLPCAEYACNNSINDSTKQRPFDMVYRFSPEMRMNLAREEPYEHPDAPLAKQELERRAQSKAANSEIWKEAQGAMAKYYDRKHKAKTYKKGDMVLLSSKHIRMRRACKKLADKFIGPFEIVQLIGLNAYKLKLPKKYGRLHDTFHVSLLEPYNRRRDAATPQPVDIDGEEEWEVEKVLSARVTQGKRFYLVRWKGFSEAVDSWQPEEDLINAQEAVHAYEQERKRVEK
jgi:transposase InsO family protein